MSAEGHQGEVRAVVFTPDGHLLSGSYPFNADNPLQTVVMRLTNDPEPLAPRCPDCDPALVAIVMKALARNREDRFASAPEMGEALLELLAQRLELLDARPEPRAAVALRSRGLGTVWTTMYLGEADAVAELLELPDDVTQICLFPVAYTKGVDFSPSPRRHPARDIAYFDRFGQTRPSADDPTLVEVVAETDVKARPDVVEAAIAGSELAELRVAVEQIPGGSRIRVHAPGGDQPSVRRTELERDLAGIVAGLPS